MLQNFGRPFPIHQNRRCGTPEPRDVCNTGLIYLNMTPGFERIDIALKDLGYDGSRAWPLNIDYRKIVKLVQFDIIRDQESFEMRARLRPHLAVDLDQERIIFRGKDQKVANYMGMFGEKKRRQNHAGRHSLDIGAAHPMHERYMVIAANPHDHPFGK